MKLLWMCNVPTKRIELMKNTQQSTCVGGWLEGLSESLLADKDIELCYCYPEYKSQKLGHGKKDNFKYYAIPISYYQATVAMQEQCECGKIYRKILTDLKEIRIFSRDEKKQDDMRHELQARHPEAAKKVKFYIGDVRNPQSIKDAMPGVDYIFHAAALKQVPSCEFFPMQAVQTNIIGTDNVLHAAIDAGVKRVVCLSTDKAAYPINAMGISKAMMEHVIYANARVAAERGGTTICCTRYGNVMCSRGSVIPLFIDQIKAGNPITITDPNMTRFLMNLDEAVDLVMFAFQHGNPGDLFIQKSDASTIGDLAKAVQQLFGDTGTNIIGTRHGEKLFETLMTREERLRSEDMGHYFRVAADNRDLNYDKFVVKGEVHTMADESYTSHNTNRLDVEGTVKKIMTTEYVQNELKGIPNV